MSRPLVRLGLSVCALAVLAVGPVTSADVEPGSDLASYTLAASAPGLAVEGLYKDVALTVPETTSTLSTGGVGTGLATIAWPGPVVGNLGTTILVLQPNAPAQVTALNDPILAEAHTAGPQRATYSTLPGTVMTSTATPGHVTASSQTGTGTTLPIGTVGTVSATSEVSLRGARTAVAISESSVSHLSLAGGVIDIGSVRSTAYATSDGEQASGRGGTTVTGLLIGGVAVAVDGTGLHVAGQEVGNPLPVQTVADLVKTLGLTIELTQPHEVRQGGSERFLSGALVVVWSQNGSRYAVTLGRASATVDATHVPATPTTPDGAQAPPPATDGSPAPPAVAGGAAAAPPALSAGTPAPSTSLPAPVAAVVHALTPVALALAGGAPLPLALGLLAAGALVALGLGGLATRLLAAASATDCED
jgi:hypothetical protein